MEEPVAQRRKRRKGEEGGCCEPRKTVRRNGGSSSSSSRSRDGGSHPCPCCALHDGRNLSHLHRHLPSDDPSHGRRVFLVLDDSCLSSAAHRTAVLPLLLHPCRSNHLLLPSNCCCHRTPSLLLLHPIDGPAPTTVVPPHRLVLQIGGWTWSVSLLRVRLKVVKWRECQRCFGSDQG
jgi:hypothetical protein